MDNPITKYFNGEQAESYIFLALGIISITVALYFLLGPKKDLLRGVAIPLLLVAVLELIVGITIVWRSPKDIARVEGYLRNQPEKIQQVEIPRMEKVMKNFQVFRYVEIALVFVGIIMMYFAGTDFWRGLGLGMFSQAGLVLILDFFAERRGLFYLDYLNQLIKIN